MISMRPVTAAFLSGILIATSWPNLGNITPFLFIGFIPLLGLAERFENSSRGNIKFLLWCYVAFLVWNFIDTYWLFYVQGDFFTRFMSAFMPSFLNAFLMTLPFLLFFLTKKKLGARIGYISLPAYWIAYEFLHLNWDLSWPWLILGNSFSGNVNWIQWYEYTGALGGSLWVLSANIILFLAAKRFVNEKNAKVFIKPSLIVIIPITLSYLILAITSEKGKREEVVIIQPNIDAYGEKFSMRYDEQLKIALEQAESVRTPQTKMVLFPETALQEGCGYYVDPNSGQIQLYGLWESQLENSESLQLLRSYLYDKPQLTLLTGIPSNELCPVGTSTLTARQVPNTDRFYDSFNTAMWINKDQRDLYHKSKLVPAAEILPFASVLKPILGDVILDFGGSATSLGRQKERTVFSSPTLTSIKAAPVICYESIYGNFVGDYVSKGANLICVMTNDGWWDVTAGHKHHLAYARLRAIEHRRDVVRSANTGISAYIDQTGAILDSLGYDKKGVLKVSPALNDDKTFYTIFGDYIGWISAVSTVGFVLMLIFKKFFSKK